MKKEKFSKERGITLIALIITIIIMLILVTVSIVGTIEGGLFNKAGQASDQTKEAANAENELSLGKVSIINQEQDIDINEYVNQVVGSEGSQTPQQNGPNTYSFSYFTQNNGTTIQIPYGSTLILNNDLPSDATIRYKDTYYDTNYPELASTFTHQLNCAQGASASTDFSDVNTPRFDGEISYSPNTNPENATIDVRVNYVTEGSYPGSTIEQTLGFTVTFISNTYNLSQISNNSTIYLAYGQNLTLNNDLPSSIRISYYDTYYGDDSTFTHTSNYEQNDVAVIDLTNVDNKSSTWRWWCE